MSDNEHGFNRLERQLIENARLMLAYERGEYEPPKVKTVALPAGETPRTPDPPAPLTDEDLAAIETRLARVADVSSFDYAANPAAAAQWDIEEIVEDDAPALLAEVQRLRGALAAALAGADRERVGQRADIPAGEPVPHTRR